MCRDKPRYQSSLTDNKQAFIDWSQTEYSSDVMAQQLQSMHTDKITIQESVKAYLSLVLHINEETSSPLFLFFFTQSLKEHT